MANKGDLLIAITGSGNSPNILAAVREANALQMTTIGLLGFDGGECKALVDLPILVRDQSYGPVEDAHMVLDHFVTECLKQRLAADMALVHAAGLAWPNKC